MLLRIRSALLCLGLLIFAAAVQAEPVTFVRDYTYKASENDSKVSARKAALQQLQALLIEEVGVQVQSSFSSQQKRESGEFSRTVQSNIQTLAQALTKTRVLEERWNGETFYVKAEVEVDPDGVAKQLAQLSGEDACEAKTKAVVAVLKRSPSVERNAELIALAKSAPIDGDCHQWQYGVAEQLALSPYPIEGYREFLFAQLEQVKGPELQHLVPALIKTALPRGDFSETEWRQLTAALRHIPAGRFMETWSYLSEHTVSQKPDARRPERHKQSVERLQAQIEQILALADQQAIGTPPVPRGQVAMEIYKNIRYDQPDLSDTLIKTEYRVIHQPETLLGTLVTRLLRMEKPSLDNPAGHSLLLLMSRLEDKSEADIGRMYAFEQDLMELLTGWDDKKTSEHAAAIAELVRHQGALLSKLLRSRRMDNTQRDLLFIRYQIPSSPACEPEACAKQLFGDSENDAYSASLFLLAYGTRAAAQESYVVRKLERVRAARGGGPFSMGMTLVNLYRFLEINPTARADVLQQLVTSVDDRGSFTAHDEAIGAMAGNYPQVVEVIFADFENRSSLGQRRLIEALGKMPHSPRIVDFLQALQPKDDDHMRFAIEDALERQQGGS